MWSFAGITFWLYGTVPNAMLLRRFTKYTFRPKRTFRDTWLGCTKQTMEFPDTFARYSCIVGLGSDTIYQTPTIHPPPPAHELCKKDTWSLGLFRLPPHNPPKYYIFLTFLARVPRAKPHQLPHHCVSRRICKCIFIHLEFIVRPAETTTLYILTPFRANTTRQLLWYFCCFQFDPPATAMGSGESDKSNCSLSFKNTTIVGRSGTRP